MLHIVFREMSTKKTQPHALNDATCGQLGEEPRADDNIPDSINETDNSRLKAAWKISRD